MERRVRMKLKKKKSIYATLIARKLRKKQFLYLVTGDEKELLAIL